MQNPEETFFAERYQANKSGALRSDNAARLQTLAVGCPFCMTQMEDALKSRSLEESMRVRDLSELIAESTETAAK
jgi:Fe-S oxidoreductase